MIDSLQHIYRTKRANEKNYVWRVLLTKKMLVRQCQEAETRYSIHINTHRLQLYKICKEKSLEGNQASTKSLYLVFC